MNSYLNMLGLNTPRNGMTNVNGLQNRNDMWGGYNYGGVNFTPTPQNGKQWYQEGGSGQNPWGGGSIYDNPYGQDALFRLAQTLYGGAIGNAAFNSGWAEPRFQAGIKDMYGMLTPSGAANRYNAFKTAATNDATSRGAASAEQLKAMGFSPAAQAGVQTNAINQAREDSNSYWQDIADPYKMAQQKLQLLSQAGNSPTMSSILQLFGMGAGKTPERGASLFESVLGGLGGAAGLGWNPFGGKK